MSTDNNFLSFELGKREKYNGDSENERSHERIGWSGKVLLEAFPKKTAPTK